MNGWAARHWKPRRLLMCPPKQLRPQKPLESVFLRPPLRFWQRIPLPRRLKPMFLQRRPVSLQQAHKSRIQARQHPHRVPGLSATHKTTPTQRHVRQLLLRSKLFGVISKVGYTWMAFRLTRFPTLILVKETHKLLIWTQPIVPRGIRFVWCGNIIMKTRCICLRIVKTPPIR